MLIESWNINDKQFTIKVEKKNRSFKQCLLNHESWIIDDKQLMWSKQMRCLVLLECSTITELLRQLWKNIG